MQGLSATFLQAFGGWTLTIASAALIFCAAVLILPHGKYRIGGPDSEPEFRTVTWWAMMFAAGMGSGLVFWGAAEPLIHITSPPPGEALIPESEGARARALAITQFHWGLHAWAIYAVAAIAIGVSFSGRGAILPSSAFGNIPGRAKRVIDLVSLVAVLFGIVASMGQTVYQIGAGIGEIGGPGVTRNVSMDLSILLLLTAGYMISLALGLRRGIAVLSNVNMTLTFLLTAFIFIAGPQLEIIRTLFDSIGAYAGSFVELSVSLREDGEPRQWTSDWTLTYLLWWVAWTPFVGVFLARISRGRSLRTFVAAAVIVPFGLTLIWFSVLGGAAISLQQSGIDLGVSNFETAPRATYALLSHFPFATAMQMLTAILVSIFLITSADSGAYVLAMFSERDPDPKLVPRIFWGLVLAAMTAGALLSEGGQYVTRALAVAGAIPLTFLLFAQAVAAGRQLFFLRRQDD